jgi:signal transduction histidine kinase
MRLLPQTIFWRLFTATVGVVITTLIVIVVLVIHERRELSFRESGAGAVASGIVRTSTELAKLQGEARERALHELREQPLVIDRQPSRRTSRRREDSRLAERTFAHYVQQQLGKEYRVTAQTPRTPPEEVIKVLSVRGSDLRVDPPGDASPSARLFDVVVTLPDGDEVVFRAPAPRGGPPLPATLLLELGVLTLLLGIVLYAMTRTITRPLKELARAADAIGRGQQVPLLTEHGAREIRGATRAFNAMQERLRRYLDSRTRVLAAMSHDLRTPLTRLRLRVESIEDEDLRQRCAQDLDEMACMIQGALSVFRGLNDDENVVDIDINALLSELQRQYGETGRLIQIVGRAAAPFAGRPLALKRCLSNLIDNALQYGKQATLEVIDDGELIIRVLDDGPGIPEESLEQVFEPFFRLESSRNRETGGTGLGLSIARDIAQAHGGSLVLRNRTEGGLAAILTLPRGAPIAQHGKRATYTS